MERSKGLTRSQPMKRGTKPMKRGKRLGPGKKTKAKRDALTAAFEAYYSLHGWKDAEGGRWVPCQLSGQPVSAGSANLHHKTPRSELRKAGVLDLDAPHRLLVCHYRLHLAFLHGGRMGRPAEGDAARRFAIAEQSPASAANGERVEWNGQDALDLDRLRNR